MWNEEITSMIEMYKTVCSNISEFSNDRKYYEQGEIIRVFETNEWNDEETKFNNDTLYMISDNYDEIRSLLDSTILRLQLIQLHHEFPEFKFKMLKELLYKSCRLEGVAHVSYNSIVNSLKLIQEYKTLCKNSEHLAAYKKIKEE